MACKIKYYRNKLGYKLSYLSKVSNVSFGYLSKLENGVKTNPTLNVMTKIANALEEDITTIFGNE